MNTIKYTKRYKSVIQLNFEASNNDKYKIRNIWNNTIFAKKSKVDYFLVKYLPL